MHYDFETVKRFLISAALNETEMVCDYVQSFGVFADATWGGKPTALCYSALHANDWLVGFLLHHGADANHRDALDMTPLHYAVLGGCPASIRKLLGAGASTGACNRFGKTAEALLPPRLEAARRRAVLRSLSTRPRGAFPASAWNGNNHRESA
jgi:hypothetical protein